MASNIRIYLDTSDFSSLCDAVAGRPDKAFLLPVFQKLDHWAQSKKITIAYSATMLSELLQYADGGRELTLRKAALVERLCGNTTYRHFIDLAQLELAARRGQLPCVEPLSSNGDMFPDLGETDTTPFRKRLEASLMEELKHLGQNRHHRKVLKARVLAQIRSPEALTKFAKGLAQDPKYQKYPIEDHHKFIQMILDAIAANESEGALHKRVMESISSPTKFVEYYFEIWRTDDSFSYLVSGPGKQLADAIRKAQESAKSRPDLPLDAIHADLSKRKFGMGLKATRGFLEFGARDSAGVSDEEIRKMPSARILDATVDAYVRDHFLKGGRKGPKESDGGDMFHALYLPYCDLWRGDSYFVGLVRRALPEFRPKIVANLTDLPAAIEARLAA